MAVSRRLRRSSCLAATLPIVLNAQSIVNHLTETNQRSMWASRRIVEDEQLYIIHVQGNAGIGLPVTLVVKKLQSVDGIVDAEEGEPPLSWPQRKAIAIGVAQGLCHLHHGCNRPIVHHNITSNNILLDQELNAKIASFGAAQMNMAGLNQPLPIAGFVFGSFGYTAPGYLISFRYVTSDVLEVKGKVPCEVSS
ncbi:probable serine/threonine-protein kinase PBL21 [Aegilops tauschii subsp. strangulata]|uniref:probable serine/threonine-protein kinase PBL21 n=1 Tax=Aegilops tauschii subsp. strangulata TaxID=200361 RepID=UPI003CC85056